MILALMWAALPGVAAAHYHTEETEEVYRPSIVEMTGYLWLSPNRWEFDPGNNCFSVGGSGPSCSFGVAGTWVNQPAGVGPDCLSGRQGIGGVGKLRVGPNEPYFDIAISDFGWRMAEGFLVGGYGALVMSGKWTDGEDSGRIQGVLLTNAHLPSTPCVYRFIQGALHFLPDDVPTEP